MPPPRLPAALVYVDRYSPDVFTEFVDAMGGDNSPVQIERVPTPGPMAGVEWLLPTAVVLYLSKSYFDGFLKEMGKDHYTALRSGLATLWKDLIAPDREIKLRVIGSSGKVDTEATFSHEFSIYTETHDGRRMKFLLEAGTRREEYLRTIDAIMGAVEDYHSGNPHSFLRRQVVSANVPRSLYLIRFDPETRRVVMVDAVARSKSPARE